MNLMMKRGMRTVSIWGNRLATVAIVVCTILICAASMIQMDMGKEQKTYIQTPLERNRTKFEDSELFYDVLKYQISDITRMCVIRNQMETNGKYNGRKKIDISQFANREDITGNQEASAVYYLDDLIKWGNYGFDYETIQTAEGNKSILYQRYKTVDGKVLSDYAKNDEEYRVLVNHLQKAATELFLNYTEYTKYLDTYNDSKTNIMYCYGFSNQGRMEYYTNLDENFNGKTADAISSKFSKYNRFISYYPDKMQIITNTDINAQDLRAILSEYEYSFQDNSRVWIAVSDDYSVNDRMKETYTLYTNGDPYFIVWLVVLFASVILWIFTFGRISRNETRVSLSDRKLKYTNKVDRIPFEMDLIIVLALALSLLYFIKEVRLVFFHYPAVSLAVFAGILIFLYHIIGCSLYLSVLRKCHNKTIFKNSIIYCLFKKIRKAAIETYDNGNIVSRTWIPYLLFLIINLLLCLFGMKTIAIAFIMDMGVGAYLYVQNKERQKIIQGIEKIKDGDFTYKLSTTHVHGDNLQLANSVNCIGSAIQNAVEKSMKDEKLKADLITNVSHDIKTPLTSIISYVDLIKHEQIENEKIRKYVEVLDAKSQRLKQLTDDLVEASKISSGNITVQYSRIDFVEFIHQTMGEFSEKFEEKKLSIVMELPEHSVFIKADSRHLFRVIENLYHNIYKYALEGTRVYLNLEEQESEAGPQAVFSLKNISSQPLHVTAEELTERFVQGDEARLTEGSGLGLSIAKNLVQSFGGKFNLQLDGDLFKVILTFQLIE